MTLVLSEHFDAASMRERLESRVQDAYRALLKKAIEPVLSPKIGPPPLTPSTRIPVTGPTLCSSRHPAPRVHAGGPQHEQRRPEAAGLGGAGLGARPLGPPGIRKGDLLIPGLW